jgi:hypothetical protein
MKKIAVVCPTRNRPQNAERCFSFFKKNSGEMSNFYLIIRKEEEKIYQNVNSQKIFVSNSPRFGMCDPLNEGVDFILSKNSYDHIFFLGDDHIIKTEKWDEKFLNFLNDKIGILYGNDLLRGEKLPTACLISTKIIKTLGYMAYPKLCHLYIDNYWKELGIDCNILKYFDDVVIEHLHYKNKKSQIDKNYEIVNSKKMFYDDYLIFEEWKKNNKFKEVKKIKELL